MSAPSQKHLLVLASLGAHLEIDAALLAPRDVLDLAHAASTRGGVTFLNAGQLDDTTREKLGRFGKVSFRF